MGRWNIHVQDAQEHEKVGRRVPHPACSLLPAPCSLLPAPCSLLPAAGLVLDFEEAVTHQQGEQHYNLGAHFLWIGDRTRQLDGAHVEYFRGIANPMGIKVPPLGQSCHCRRGEVSKWLKALG
jgi:3-deoxy-D-arabino-heptulosonate 7-phosphate (DAHP) synthase